MPATAGDDEALSGGGGADNDSYFGQEVAVCGGFAFVVNTCPGYPADDRRSLEILDVATDPANPTLVTSF